MQVLAMMFKLNKIHVGEGARVHLDTNIQPDINIIMLQTLSEENQIHF